MVTINDNQFCVNELKMKRKEKKGQNCFDFPEQGFKSPDFQ